MAQGPIEDYTSLASKVYIRAEFQEIARDYLEPLRRCDIDTLVLGCTHFPLLKSLIGGVIGREVRLINSAREVARDVERVLEREGLHADGGMQTDEGAPTRCDSESMRANPSVSECAAVGAKYERSLLRPTYEFFTTGNDLQEFKKFGERVFRQPLQNVSHTEV